MSKKKDILIVGFLSATLFTGFTAYSQLGSKGKAAALPVSVQSTARPAGGTQVESTVKNVTQESVSVQAPTDGVTDQTPPAGTTRKKNTKTKAS